MIDPQVAIEAIRVSQKVADSVVGLTMQSVGHIAGIESNIDSWTKAFSQVYKGISATISDEIK